MIKNILSEIKIHSKNGIFHIFGSNILSQVAGLLSSIIVIRRLPKDSYGYYVNANNIYSYIAVFVGLGLVSAVMQFCSEKIDEEKKNTIYRFTFSLGNVFNIFLFIGILVYGLILKNSDVHTGQYLSYMAGIPFVVYCYNYFKTVLRVKRKNKEFAYTNAVFTIASLITHIIFTYIWGTIGLIFALYISYISSMIFMIPFLKKDHFISNLRYARGDLTANEKRNIVSFSSFCAITNFTSSLLVLLDVTCLNIVLKDPEILADYKVASVIPSACLFVPSCLITYFYPIMVENYSNGVMYFKEYIYKLAKIFFCVNLIVFIFIEIFSPMIINIVYGDKYENVSNLFRILGINYLVCAFKSLLGNSIVVIKKVKINFIHTSISGLLNVLLNLVLIQKYQSAGAAYATVIVSTFIVGLDTIYLHRYFKKNA